ncbi:MAG TPA: hypothetical protein VE077_09040 [Candidatus Methylomirabilis sp.]|nr:hypothetical protein [Candidatus Methylomirabilis sp.]
MTKAFACGFLVAILPALPLRGTKEAKAEYKAKDGSRVVIVTATKSNEGAGQESAIEFYSTGKQWLCTLDYSSDDGQHGFAVAKAAWTPDEKYFVFSLASSGGHQPWHAPTLFFSVADRAVFDLDGVVKGVGISRADFTLQAPNTVVTEIWTDEQTPADVAVALAKLVASDRGKSRPLACTGGKIIKRELQVVL